MWVYVLVFVSSLSSCLSIVMSVCNHAYIKKNHQSLYSHTGHCIYQFTLDPPSSSSSYRPCMLSCTNRKVVLAPLLEPAEIQATQISRHLRYCLLPSHAHQGRGLPEREQWLFSRLLMDNLLLLREVVKRLALQQSLWLNLPAFGTMDLIAQHIHTLAPLPVYLTHEGLRIFKGIRRYFPLLSNTFHSSDVLFTALEKLDWFPLPLTM